MTKSRAFLFLIPLLTLILLHTPLTHAADVPQNLVVIDSALNHSIDLKGKVVYVDFWASWCVPCRSSFPWMQRLAAQDSSKGLVIITVNLDKDHKAAEKFLNDMKTSLPVVFDSTGVLAEQYNLEVMPTSFVYGRDGKLRQRHEGFKADKTTEMDLLIEDLLKEEASQ